MTERTKIPLFLYMLPLLTVVAIWQFGITLQPQGQFIFSSPQKYADAAWRLVVSGELVRNSGITIFEAICGFLIGTTCGAALGLSLWYSRVVAKVAEPYIAALGAIPVFSLAPIIIVWFGIGLTSKIALAAFSTAIVALVQAYRGSTCVEERYLRLMQVWGASRFQTFRVVIVPSSLIWVVNAMKLNIGLALLGAFVGEFISSEQGLGYMIVKASGLYDSATVLVGVTVLALIALAFNFAIEKIERRILHWNIAN